MSASIPRRPLTNHYPTHFIDIVFDCVGEFLIFVNDASVD
jgi:hypothetical protein